MAHLLGIYFGPTTICLVETTGKKIINAVKIPRTALSQDDLEEKVPEEVKLVAVFSDEFRNSNIQAQEATLALSGKDLIVRTFELPVLPANELDNAITFEAKKYIPFKAEDLVSDFQVEFDKKTKKNIVLYIGIRKDILDKYFAIFKQLGIKLSNVDYSAFSVLRMLKLAGAGQSGVIGLMSMDSQEDDEANFMVLDNGFPVFSRDITLASPAEGAGLPAETTREQLLDKLKTELRISLDYYNRKFPQKKIVNMFFITDENLRYELEFFVREMELSVQFVNTAKYLGKDQVFSLSVIKGFGGALARVVKTKLKLNLLSPKKQIRAPKKVSLEAPEVSSIFSGFKLDLRFILLGALICGAVYAFGLYRLQPVRNDVRTLISLRPKIKSAEPSASLDKLQKTDADYKNKIKLLNDLITQQPYLTGPMEAVARSIPEDVWITDFSFVEGVKQDKSELRLQGFVYAEDSDRELGLVNTFITQLKESKEFSQFFKEARILSVEKQQLGQVQVSSFVISCRN
ncbi:MAG: pilus assembly protein PilM [Candidatus Omnitrophica bacterium]|nr:pilus assembly protein PilM [Candidatus Omnitrophota bacterium]